MSIIQNYDARLALSDYKIGHAYVFYIQNSNMHRLVKVKETDFDKHIKALTDSIEVATNIIKNNEQHLNFTRSHWHGSRYTQIDSLQRY